MQGIINRRRWIAGLGAAVLGVAFTFTYISTVFNIWTEPFAKLIFIGLYLVGFFTIVSFWLFNHIVFPFLEERNWIRSSIKITGLILLLFIIGLSGVFIIPLHFDLLPSSHSIRITATGYQNDAAQGNEVRIIGLYQVDGKQIGFQEFKVDQANWFEQDGQLIHSGKNPSTVEWNGNTSQDLRLIFIAHPWSGKVSINWNGSVQDLDLYAGTSSTKVVNSSDFVVRSVQNQIYKVIVVLMAGISIGFLVLVVLILTVKFSSRIPLSHQVETITIKRVLLYAAPMVLVWMMYLLAFWPAVMTIDSIDQWGQIQTGNYNDWHPVFHTLFVWLLTRLSGSPTSIAVFQIFALSLLVAWQLAYLRKWGLSDKLAWVISILFALSPVNGLMVVTVWKDIPYSIALLALSFLIFNISLDPKSWFEKKFLWVWVGILAVLVGLFRHNGSVVALITMLSLVILFWKQRMVFLRSLVLLVVLWLFFKGPIYNFVGAQTETVLGRAVALHQIAAHVSSGTSINDEERRIIEQIQPWSKWDYYCYFVNPVILSESLNVPYVVSNPAAINSTALSLFEKAPWVTIKHILCSGSMVYRVTQPEDGYLYLSSIWEFEDTKEVHYVQENPYGVVPASKFPGFARLVVKILEWSSQDQFIWFVWRPAFYLYLSLFIAGVFFVRNGSLRSVYFLIPAILQSLTLLVVNIAQDARYQYSIYLLSIFFLVLLFIPAVFEKQQKTISFEQNHPGVVPVEPILKTAE